VSAANALSAADSAGPLAEADPHAGPPDRLHHGAQRYRFEEAHQAQIDQSGTANEQRQTDEVQRFADRPEHLRRRHRV